MNLLLKENCLHRNKLVSVWSVLLRERGCSHQRLLLAVLDSGYSHQRLLLVVLDSGYSHQRLLFVVRDRDYSHQSLLV